MLRRYMRAGVFAVIVVVIALGSIVIMGTGLLSPQPFIYSGFDGSGASVAPTGVPPVIWYQPGFGITPTPAEGEPTPSNSTTDTTTISRQLPQKRIVLKNAELNIVVKNAAETLVMVTTTAESLGGWVVSSTTSQRIGSSGNKLTYTTITVRVPADKLTMVLDKIKSAATIINTENVTGSDVTSQYVDLNSQLTNLEAAETQLRKLMDSAKATEDILKVYTELVRVRGEIDRIRGQIKFFDEASAFSSITVAINSEDIPAPIAVGGWQPLNTVRNALQMLVIVVQGVLDLLIWIVLTVVPCLLPFGIAFLLIRRFRPGWLSRPAAPSAAPESSAESR